MMRSAVLLGLSVAAKPTFDHVFDHVFALGDSFSDTGALFRMAGIPDASVYWEGRFSDGMVWVEYLAKNCSAELTSLAVGGATTDQDSVPNQLLPAIPGCLQQAARFVEMAPRDKKTLVTMAFVGNDFFHGGNASTYMDNMRECVDVVAKSGAASSILVTTSFLPEIVPFFGGEGKDLKETVVNATREISAQWSKLLKDLRANYPAVKFTGYDMGATLQGIFKRGLEQCHSQHFIFDTTGTCHSFTPFQQNIETKFCRFKKPMFHDLLHPTTRVHEALAARAYQDLQALPRGAGNVPYRCYHSIIKSSKPFALIE